MSKDFEIALIVPYVSGKVESVEGFLTGLRREYAPSVLKSISLYCWSASDSLGIILSFDFYSFLPSSFDAIRRWAEKAEAKIFELMASVEEQRKEFKAKFMLTSDLKFTGAFDISRALESILKRIGTTTGRKSPRYVATIEVRFKTKEEFVKEYTKDISKGGIFVATEKPLPVKTRAELVLILPDSPEEVKVTGEIVHAVGPEQARLAGHGNTSGMGIQFIEFQKDGAKILESYFKSIVGNPQGH